MDHLSTLGMRYVPKEELLYILKTNLKEEEAKILLSLPTRVIPFQGSTAKKISANFNIPIKNLEKILGKLSTKGLLYSHKREVDGENEYAIQQIGFVFPKFFFGREWIIHIFGKWLILLPSILIKKLLKRYLRQSPFHIDLYLWMRLSSLIFKRYFLIM